jgi:uncharacterized protein (TIGR02147 family)
VRIYEYVEYRLFLQDLIREKKLKCRGFSLRLLAKKAQFSSPGYIQSILKGEKRLRPESAANLSRALQLNDLESKYFCYLVNFNQADKIEKKSEYLLGMQTLARKIRSRSGTQIFSLKQDWYNLAIMELAHCKQVELSPESLLKLFSGRVPLKSLQQALEFLTNSGYLKRSKGKLVPSTSHELQTSDEIESLYVREIHRKSLEIASESLNLPLQSREYQHITIAISDERLDWLKVKLKQLREELVDALAHDPSPRRVYHVNLQAFPVTESIE